MSAIRNIDAELVRSMPLPVPAGDADKNSRGRVLVVGGSRRVPGAVVLSGMAALRVGAGKIQLAVPGSLSVPIGLTAIEAGTCALDESPEGEPLATSPAALLSAARAADAVLIGPGILSEESARELTRCLLSQVIGPVYVIDALALCELWDEKDLLQPHAGRVVLTPHAGEMAKLSGMSKAEVDADPLSVAREAASHLSCVVVLKGVSTFVVTPAGMAYRHRDGVVGLATAGSGDVLAGILAGVASRGASPAVAATWSVFLHGRAGRHLSERVGPLGFIARELPDELPALLQIVQNPAESPG